MTRINASIKPQELPDKLLLSELREIKRIPNLISKGRYSLNGIPDKFTLGTGHVKFFYNKGMYTKKRYTGLYNEAVERGFNVTDFSDAWDIYSSFPALNKDWEETKESRSLIVNRIKDRGFDLIINVKK
jgi:hypothetical protein